MQFDFLQRALVCSALGLLASSGTAQADVVASYPFGTPGSLFPPTLPVVSDASTDTEPNSVASPFDRGAGLAPFDVYSPLVGNPAPSYADSFFVINSTNASQALASAEYFNFSVAPLTGFELNFASLSLDTQIGFPIVNASLSQATFFVRSSVDGFATTIGSSFVQNSSSFTPHLLDLSAPMFQGLMSPVEFRIYVYEPNASPMIATQTQLARIDNVVLNGSVVSAVPEPATTALVGMALLALLGATRRAAARRWE